LQAALIEKGFINDPEIQQWQMKMSQAGYGMMNNEEKQEFS